MTLEEGEEESEFEEICRTTQINRKLPDNNNHYGIELKTNETKQKFAIDNGFPVTIMPNNPNLFKTENIRPQKERYYDVDKNQFKFLWENVGGRRTRYKNQTAPTNHQTKRFNIPPWSK